MVSFIIGYHTLNQMNEMPYVQISTSEIFRCSKNESSLGVHLKWSTSTLVCKNLGIHPNQFFEW